MALMMVLTTTTKPMDLTYSFEWYMTPLKVVKFPVHEVAMVLSIAIRFIPTLLDETNRILLTFKGDVKTVTYALKAIPGVSEVYSRESNDPEINQVEIQIVSSADVRSSIFFTT